MTTSISDLFNAIDIELASDGGCVRPGDAAAALMHVGRLLKVLSKDGLSDGRRGEREAAANGLGIMCGLVGEAWPPEPGRTVALAGAVSDAVGRLHDELTMSDRWRAAIRLGSIANKCVAAIESSGPYDHSSALDAIKKSMSNLRRCAVLHPPEPSRGLGLDRPIPGMDVDQPMSAAYAIHHAAAGILDALKRHGRESIGVRQAIAICRASGELAKAAEAVSPNRGNGDASVAWQKACQQLEQFEDGRRFGVRDDLMRQCATIARSVGPILEGGTELGVEDRDQLKRAATLLPAIAAALDIDLRTERRTLIVPVGDRPLREERVGEWLRKTPFIASRADVQSVHKALASAGRALDLVECQAAHKIPEL